MLDPEKRKKKRAQSATARSRKRQSSPTYLGSICPAGHDHESSGKSLRYTGNGACVVCERERNNRPESRAARHRYAKSEKGRSAMRRFYEREDRLVEKRLRSLFHYAMRTYGSGKKLPLANYFDYAAVIESLGPCPGPRSDWHIDHVEPCCSFDHNDPEQVRQCWSPQNLRWLPKKHNLQKAGSDRRKRLRRA